MNKSSTTISDPQTGDSRTFTFDNSYWSHDGFKINKEGIYESASPVSPYVDQVVKQIYHSSHTYISTQIWNGTNQEVNMR